MLVRPFFITWFTDFFLKKKIGSEVKKKFLSFFIKFPKYLSQRVGGGGGGRKRNAHSQQIL